MHPFLQQHRTDINALCRRYGVLRLDVFGSAARGEDFDPTRSDVDLLVEFDRARTRPSFSAFFDLRERLAKMLGRSVDLVMAGAIRNPYVQADIERSRETLY